MTPTKPFDTYKWRWLSVIPTENLLQVPVFLGVLRVLSRHEGKSKGSREVFEELLRIDNELDISVTLARPESNRNLIRNSGQYWTGTGLLVKRRKIIELSHLGREVAAGRVTQAEFVAIVIRHTVLPNHWIHGRAEIVKWTDKGLKLWPLRLILQVMKYLGSFQDASCAYLTNDELVRIVIPLAGNMIPAEEIAWHILAHRKKELDVSGWPNCAPRANDRRFAREFLLFLSNFGVLRLDETGSRDNQKFFMDEIFDVDSIGDVENVRGFGPENADESIDQIRDSSLPTIVERQRVATSVIDRTGQSKFRRNVVQAFSGQCFLTREKIPEILEAAHIVPVQHGGGDIIGNGICLRVDVHRLFDSGNLRIKPDGGLQFSDSVKGSPNYSILPKNVAFPGFLDLKNIIWRERYY